MCYKNWMGILAALAIAAMPASVSAEQKTFQLIHWTKALQTENKRVDLMLEELRNGDIDTFLYLVAESGLSSFRFLQNVYPSSSPKDQGISLALALSEEILQGDGASRVHGGGFAGTIQAYVPESLVDRYIKGMEGLFGQGCSTRIAIRRMPVARLI